MKLWLDDLRDPWKHGCLGWTWAKTADEAIGHLKTGTVAEASLDHDLHWEHYPESEVDPASYRFKTGFDVVRWMEANNTWPAIVTVHSMNERGAMRMMCIIGRYTEAVRKVAAA